MTDNIYQASDTKEMFIGVNTFSDIALDLDVQFY